jgi:HAD superfamily hydrolase (TIGR01509 family)
MFEAVIFDMDGVIVDSHPVHKEAWRRLFKLLGKSVTEEQLDFVCDGHKRVEIVRHFLGDLPVWQLENYGRQKDAFFRALSHGLTLVPGLTGFVAQLRKREIKLAIATSASRERTEYVLNQFHLMAHFEAIVSGDDVNAGKPDPAIFQKACRLVQCVPSASLVIEDAASGIRGAKRAGMKCLGIAHPARARLLYDAGADWVEPDFTTLHASLLAGLLGVAKDAISAKQALLTRTGLGGQGTARD